MPIESPQAVGLRTKRSERSLLEGFITSQKGTVVLPPNIVIANGVCVTKRQGVAFRQIQNCGTTVVKYLIDNANLCTALNFHGILAAGSAVDDGLGSILQFNINGDRISILGVGGDPRVCVLEAIAPEGMPV